MTILLYEIATLSSVARNNDSIFSKIAKVLAIY